MERRGLGERRRAYPSSACRSRPDWAGKRTPVYGMIGPMAAAGVSTKPAAGKGALSKRTALDVIVLAFANSDVRETVGTDALRMVLDPRYIEMVRTPGVLDLQLVWDILKTQPGFDPANAAAPLCK